MPIKTGGKDLVQLIHKGTEIFKVYYGSKLVWSKFIAPKVDIQSITETSINVSWSNVDADEYVLYMKTHGGVWTNMSGVTSATSFIVTNLTTGTLYYFYVAATKGATTANSAERISATLDTTVTTPYMTSVGIAQNTTVSMYGVTGNQVWERVNTFVVTLKTNGIYNKLLYCFPKIGSSASAAAVNLLNTAISGTYFGSWVFDSKGARGNGTNTYFEMPFVIKNILTPQNGGMLIQANETWAGTQNSLMGTHSGNNPGSVWIFVEWTVNNSMGHAIGNMHLLTYRTGNYAVPQHGTWSSNALNSEIYAYRNGQRLTGSGAFSQATNSSTWTITPTFNHVEGGARMENKALAIGYQMHSYAKAVIGTSVYHDALTLTEVTTLHNAVMQFEKNLNRYLF